MPPGSAVRRRSIRLVRDGPDGWGTQTRLRWGIPDALIAFVLGVVASVPAAVGLQAGEAMGAGRTFLGIVLQNAAIVLTCWVVSVMKGQRSLARDFGFPTRAELRIGVVTAWIAIGVVASVGVALLLRPIEELGNFEESAQDVARTLRHADGLSLVLLLVGIVVVAPVVEELLFRGLLLRALQRRFTTPAAVAVSAFVFAAVHLAGGRDAYAVVPGLFLLGLAAGVLAARSGNLTRSIALHMGFNLLSAVALVLS